MAKVENHTENSPQSSAKTSEGHIDTPSIEIDLAAAARQHLESLQQFGVSFLPTMTGRVFDLPDEADAQQPPQPSNATPTQPVAQTAQTSTAQTPTPVAQPVQPQSPPAAGAPPKPIVRVGNQTEYPADPGGDRNDRLAVIQAETQQCTRCEELASCRTQTVFGAGNPNARLVLLGEAPGEREDKVGEPFVGAAGQLLDKMLAACGLNRKDDVYILSAIKCRPPRNRTPKPEELENCWGFAQQQLDILQPEFICCLGSVAARTLLQTTLSVGRLRKQLHSYRGSKVLVTYHPVYLLRTTSAKSHAWEDLQMLMKAMGIAIPPRS